jgi:hypothetical protein
MNGSSCPKRSASVIDWLPQWQASDSLGVGFVPCPDSYSSTATDFVILSAASRLSDRQTVWVARQSDDTPFNRTTTEWGIPAHVYAAQFAEVHSTVHRCPISGWVSQQG